MNRSEIQYRFEEMTKIRDSAHRELDTIHEMLSAPWDAPKDELVWFAGVPLGRERDHVPIIMNQIRDAVNNSCYYSEYSAPSKQRYPFDQYTPKNKLDIIQPTLHGVGLASGFPDAILEIRRDGVIVFGKRNNMSAGNEISVHIIYEIWASGICLLKDIQDRWGVSSTAVVQTGLQGLNRGQTICGTDRKGTLPKDRRMRDIRFDAIMLSEGWKPKEVLREYAGRLANAVHLEQALKCPPWIE